MSVTRRTSSRSNNGAEAELPSMFPDILDYETEEKCKKATACETQMGKWMAVKTWLPGVIYAMCISLSCIMEGYGLVIITGFFASPKFKTDFGCPMSYGGEAINCEVPAKWQTALVDGALGGQMVEIVLNGWLTERYGYKKTFLGAMGAISCFVCITFFATNLPILLVGLVLCGIPWGIFQTLTTSYASDVCPTPIRAYFTMWSNLCWVLGQLGGALVQRILVNNNTVLSYKLPFALQWVFPIPIIIAALLAPESPWWLIRQGRSRHAYKAMEKLTSMKSAPADYSIENHIAMLYKTNKDEENDKVNGGSKMGYIDCFKGIHRRRTVNTCLIWAMQNSCGSPLMQFSTYFFLQAGLGPEWAFTFTLIQYAIGIIGTIISWLLVTKAGRRTLYLHGLLSLLFLLLLTGTISLLPIRVSTSGLVIGTLLLFFTLAYNSTVGPITYSLVSELPSTRLKSKTINLARACYLLVGLLNGAVTPLMLNPEAANWGARSAWLFASITALCVLYTFFCVPEPKDLTYGQIDELYARGVSAREFRVEGQRLRDQTKTSREMIPLVDRLLVPVPVVEEVERP